ncbi:GRIP1-associated protein 1 [Patella vulgata]|uniref:GRIP1-associated protein 1 n=1 Tax=Patella vulgata TaxID=6465 RepID=UPI00217FDF34|nr:GRIP1-associated protein 1 [Patella vulgata]
MASSALSEDEFHRLQLQLLELRTANYELEGKCKKYERELTVGQERVDVLDKELTKASKVINKSKKTKEVELLMQENDGLQRKLHSQEEEFRLQNQTLMQELSTLVASNEQLEKEITACKDGNTSVKGSNSDLEDEIRRLQAQNAALQKNYNSIKEKYEKELLSLRGGNEVPPSTERESPTGVEERKVEGSDHKDDEVNKINTESANSIEKLSEEIHKLKISLDTELEEKKILKEELSSQEKKLKDKIVVLQDESEKFNEKLKKKQESVIILQKEKEDMFAESSKKIEELQAGRERDKKYYQDVTSKLQTEIEKLKQVGENDHTSAEQKMQQLEKTITTLQSQVDAANIVGNQQLQEQTKKYQSEIIELRNNITKLIQEKDDLQIQLKESQKAVSDTMEQFHAAQNDRDSQIQSLQEISKVAEKRKSILDELAIKYQKEIDSHREIVNSMEEKHKVVVNSLQQGIVTLQEKIAELEKQTIMFEELQQTHKSVSESKQWLERRLKETEENLDQAKVDHETSLKEMKSSHETEINKLKEEHQAEAARLLEEQQTWRTGWEEKENTLLQEIENLKTSVSSLRQEIKDGVGDKKLHEKKGLTMIKDLKRQLHAERKRTEKLQERLQEVLTDSKDRQSMEDLFRPTDPNDMFRCDDSSVSSWGAGASGNKDSNASGPQSPSHTNTSFTSDVEQEYGDLLTRMGGMQQNSWQLEEKVAHLEMSNACMAEDILRKTAIIEHYVMESRPDHRRLSNHHPHEDKISLKKVLDLVNKGEDNELKDMNKKLQNMVEETLTKNMHLQKDLEMMSNEVVRLSKLTQSDLTDSSTKQKEMAS